MWKPVAASELLTLDARQICIIKPSALGDVVQTLPLLPALKERFPKARLSWVVNRELSELLEGNPHLDEIIPFDRRGSLAGWMRLLGDLRLRQFDLVFDLQGLLRTGLMTMATAAPVRVGLESAREGAYLACNCTLPDTGRWTPAHMRYWRVAEAVGRGDLRRETTVAIRPADRAWALEQSRTLPGPVLAVHPGARWITKRWPVEKFAVVACKAMQAYGLSPVVLGSRSEIALAAQFEQALRRFLPSARILNLAGQTSLKQLAAVLEASTCLLTNDSGPMHLAAGLGTPVVAVFTCTSPLRSGPPGDRHELVSTFLPCAASYKKTCPRHGRKHLACMDELTTERVWQAFGRLMEKDRQHARAA